MILSSIFYVLSGCSSNQQAERTDATPSHVPAFSSDSVESVQTFEQQAAGSSTISGRIFFKGPAPPTKPINTYQDPACAVERKEPIYSEDVVLNADSTLANVFVYIKAGVTQRYAAPAAPRVLDQHYCRYSPHVIGIQVGQTLKILNSDPTFHNVHASAQNNKPFNLGMSKVEKMKTRTFDEAEVMIPLRCNVHPWMSAYVGVLDHPFYSVTDSAGNFKLQAVPAGEYVLAAWHEVFGSLEQKIKLADHETKTVDFIFTRR